jgi:hypothetical protein
MLEGKPFVVNPQSGSFLSENQELQRLIDLINRYRNGYDKEGYVNHHP